MKNAIKPVRINRSGKIASVEKKLTKNFEKFFSVLAGQRVNVHGAQSILIPLTEYVNSFNSKKISIQTVVKNQISGHVYFFIDENVFQEIYATQQQEKDLENIQLPENFIENNINEIYSFLSSQIQDISSENYSLEKKFTTNLIENHALSGHHDTAEEYVVLQFNIKLPQFIHKECSLVIIRSLFELLMGEDLDLEEMATQNIAIYSKNLDFLTQIKRDLNSRKIKICTAKELQDIYNLVKSENTKMIVLDFANLNPPFTQELSVFFKSLANNPKAIRLPIWVTHPGPFTEVRKAIQATGIKASPLCINEVRELLPWIRTNLPS